MVSNEDLPFLQYFYREHALLPRSYEISEVLRVRSGLPLAVYLQRAVPQNSPDYVRIMQKYVREGSPLVSDRFFYPGETLQHFALLYRVKFCRPPPRPVVYAVVKKQEVQYDPTLLESALERDVFSQVNDWRTQEWRVFLRAFWEDEEFGDNTRALLKHFKLVNAQAMHKTPSSYPTDGTIMDVTVRAIQMQSFRMAASEIVEETLDSIPPRLCQASSAPRILGSYLAKFSLVPPPLPETHEYQSFSDYCDLAMAEVALRNAQLDQAKDRLDQDFLDMNQHDLIDSVASELDVPDTYVETVLSVHGTSVAALQFIAENARCEIERLSASEVNKLQEELSQVSCHVAPDVYARYLQVVIEKHHRRRLAEYRRALQDFDFEAFHAEHVRQLAAARNEHRVYELYIQKYNEDLDASHEEEVADYERERLVYENALLAELVPYRSFLSYS